jgi:hypothetical protein
MTQSLFRSSGAAFYPPDLWDLIERRWTARTVEKKNGTTKVSEFVFHRGGKPVVDFRKVWNEARKDFPSRLDDSLRRIGSPH